MSVFLMKKVTGIIVFAVIALVFLLLLIWLIAGYNRFVKLRASVEEAFATMDVYLKRRYDLIPNLLEVVRHYTEHERSTLEAIVAGRNRAAQASGMAERMEGEAEMSRALRSLFAVAESYPELRSSEQYSALQEQLAELESGIAQARRYYNGVVRDFNTAVQVFPSNLLAGIFSFKPYPYFEVEAHERESQKIRF